MAYKDDLMAEKDNEDVFDIEGDTQYDKEVIDAGSLEDPNENDDDSVEAETIEKEENVQDLAKKSLGEEEFIEPEES